MKTLISYLTEGMSNRKISIDPKDVINPLTPAVDYQGEIGIIIGGTWSIKNRADRNNARTLIKALGLDITMDIDELTGYGDNTNMEVAWTGGKPFVYFYSPLVNEVNAFVFRDDGVMVLK